MSTTSATTPQIIDRLTDVWRIGRPNLISALPMVTATISTVNGQLFSYTLEAN